MARPSDWSPLDMDRDPTPGDPDETRELADELQEFADDVGEALAKIRGMASDRALLDWAGLSADTFRAEFEGVPDNLTKLEESYSLCAQALDGYWPKLQTAQGMADRALDRAVAAQADLASAQSALGDATDWVGRAGEESERLQREGERAGVEPPNEVDVRAATRDQQAAEAAASAARGRVNDAEERLAAARQLALDAREMREDAARECAQGIEEASDAGIQNRKWWQNVIKWVTDNWDTLVQICKVIVAVLGIVVMIIGGPLAWVVLAAALVVLADTLIKFARGEAGLLDVAFAALDCIPGMKGLTTLGGLARGLRGAASTGLRGLQRGALGLGRSIRRMGRGGDDLVCRTDPVDMATGEMVMDDTDIELPGVLPLVVRRHYRTSLREGTWFGPSWASTLDQRLVLDDGGARLVTDDGMILDFPRPLADEPVLPVEGPRWELTWESQPGGPLAVRQPETGRTLYFAPVSGRRGGELPLTALADRNGTRIRVGYGSDGAPVSLVHDGGYHVEITTEGGRVISLRLRGAADDSALVRYGYDERGNLAEIHHAPHERPRRLFYDDSRRIVRWEDRLGDWYRYIYDEQGRCVATEGRGGVLASRISYDLNSRRTLFTDSLGNTTVYECNDCYQLVREIDPLGHRTERTHDRYDRLLSLTDAAGHTVNLEWDARGNLVAIRQPDGTASTVSYNEADLPVERRARDGAVWRTEWDTRGNCVALTDPTGATATLAYDRVGALTELTDAGGGVHRFRNDATGQRVWASDPLGATTHYTYDAYGRPSTVTDPLGQVTRMTWTADGLPASRTTPDGATESWVYDGEGNRTGHTSPFGLTTRMEFGPFGRPLSRVTPDGARYAFAHDTELHLVQVVDPEGRTWDYTYDAGDHLASETDFDGRTLRYTHDPLGRLRSRVNPLGQTVTFAYDGTGCLTSKTVDEVVTHYTHDAEGRLQTATSPDVVLSLAYDPLGRRIEETVNGRTLRTAYDVRGLPVQRTTPAGMTSRFSHDAGGRRTSVTVDGHTLSSRHDAVGREVSRHIGNLGLIMEQTWDANHRLTAQTLTGPDRPTWERRYNYRVDGQPLSLVERTAGRETGRREVELDPAGRITEVRAHGWSERYAYDASGNVTHADWPASASAPEARGERVFTGTRVTRAGSVFHEYDAAGRVVLRGRKRLSRKPDIWRYDWDAEDRLVGVTTPDGTRWRYLYDARGRRAAKRRLAAEGTQVVEETHFTWDDTHLVEQTTTGVDGRESLTLSWERDGTRPLTQTERRATEAQRVVDERFFAVVTDLIGTPTELVTEDGEIAWRRDATLWGLAVDGGAATTDTPLRFPGQYHDRETESYYNYFRHYDPTTARYLTPDPLGLAAGPNPAGYVPNPLVWMDYLGLKSCSEILRDNLALDGRPVGTGQAAAHIVPSGLTRGNAPNMRALLNRYNIDINEAANGIPLGHSRPHNYTHTNVYLNRLDSHLQQFVATRVSLNVSPAQITADLRTELRSIGRQIQAELNGLTPNQIANNQSNPTDHWTKRP
ncbi:DUF6531 domain-containing protein [Streptomyces sp. DSM 44915]|uniref:DUF6531 domain-containing protein n=1 Tax=Streptomyces chisholmiae TaxID=3075540 RepID=A0ABU2JVL0_9ACTN|nr:DUF6531 domain-containing protein [Streptomyces sp. DSM 44915]MDT0269028.1 DUF6531 domain-containing protein [Streptomyces sp. DSM 44915]